MSNYFKTYTVARATIHELGKDEVASALATIAAGKKGKEQESFDPEKDLMKMVSVLVSTGKNKNDDVFLSDELKAARASGRNKPVNIEHDSDHIIGHMTRTFITDKDGNELLDDKADSSELGDFDITNEAVVYAFVKPEIANSIRRLAAAGKLFVSVEMWFTDFDFLVGAKVIKRNQATSFLEGHLRANGGDGSYKGEPVGRVLRNVLIGGIGVVEKPANPESVIRSISSLSTEVVRDVQVYKEPAISENTIVDLGQKSSKSMKDAEGDDMKELMKEIAETIKASTEAAIKKAADEKAASDVKDAAAAPAVAPADTKASDKAESPAAPVAPAASAPQNEEIKALKASVDALAAQNKKLNDKVEAMEHERAVASRREALRSIGIKPADVEKRMAKAASMTKEEFEQYRSDLQELFNSYLRGDASNDSESTGEGGTGETKEAKTSDKEDASVNASEDADETVINMDKLEDVDPDVGATTTAASSEASLEDRFASAVAGQLSHNKGWRKMVIKKDAAEGDE